MKSKIYVLMAVAALLTLGSCKKETGKMVTMTFDAVLADAAHKQGADVKMAMKDSDKSAEAKVYLDNYKPCWRKGDAIHVNNGDGSVISVESANASRGRFSVNLELPEDFDDHYYAVYPAFIGHQKADMNNTSYDLHTEQKVCLPRVQIFDTVKFGTDANAPVQQKINAPMFAYNEKYPVLQFRNLCGMLKITVSNTKAWDMVLDSIQVEATKNNLCGEMTIQGVTGVQPYLTAPAGSATDSFDVANRMNYQTVSLAGGGNTSLGMYLRSTQLKNNSNSAGNPNAPTDTTLYIYIPTTTSGSNLFYIRVFSHPAWQTGNSEFTPDPEVHISYEKRQTTSVAITRNNLYNFTIALDDQTVKPTFTSLKPFTISGNNNKVSISRGNAQYFIKTYDYSPTAVSNGNTSTGYWRFSPRQWDFLYFQTLYNQSYNDLNNDDTPDNIGRYDQYKAICQGNYYGKTWHKGWIEHFTWDSGNQPARHFHTGRLFSNIYEECDENTDFNTWHSDWGTNFTNATSGSTWFSLTKDQMNHLLYGRTSVNNSNKCNFAWVTLTDVTGGTSNGNTSYLYGIIILPDAFEMNNSRDQKTIEALGMEFSTFKCYTNATAGVEANGDNASRWRDDNVMDKKAFEYYEARGCILIPCIGVIAELGDGNDMWTETHPEASVWLAPPKHSTNDAYMLMLSADDGDILGIPNYTDCRAEADGECYRKFNVRLVRNYSAGGGNYIYDPFQ